MKTQHLTTNQDETRALGETLSRQLQPGDLITLSGPLGAGKTTFVQGVARGLEVATDATSPTFVLIIEHEGRIPLLHLDAYRLENKCFDAIRDAGVTDFLDRTDAVKLIEWPERIADFLPTPRFAIVIDYGDNDNERRIEIIEKEN
ncbi:MAG: tRNA (adenosine(37)-N6)-threonylcarbamoyltransferase complex ATPase subunit type 1 TsaE [Abitibacteriaceae bacterium]|nr:tRNA (adenosine(37)-N6)-threonylcarbamoyltransferase complex ATPase subunit type 1 TsaE [Abditibacteriaceae bacterium]MBV9866853.1 tRNA (adenosine(37)-N6)-threonylcarbamoyltransferase complex ATPase subunit type 1 TsaE [Abditibacteriaceae bacterium]